MILNEREAELINEVAEMTGYSTEEIRGAWEALKQSLNDAWESVKTAINDIFESIREKNNKPNEHTWHVPLKIKAPPMPDIQMPRMMNIRSEL